jgi:hypothetical protein
VAKVDRPGPARARPTAAGAPGAPSGRVTKAPSSAYPTTGTVAGRERGCGASTPRASGRVIVTQRAAPRARTAIVRPNPSDSN